MDVFNLRDQLVADYAEYISSFIKILDKRIQEHVEEQLTEGLLWPDPLIQLNPSFQPASTIDDLVSRGDLHPECSRIFRIDKGKPGEKTLLLHKHQEQAIYAALKGKNYILTTGTGSGKSLAYIIPIVNHVLRRGSGRGIQALIVYPMNALANSQIGELDKFINTGYPNNKGPITFARFTGQESDQQRNAIRENPPDILLTNYVMLELLLTRPEDRRTVINAARGLRFLVLDELHTYRGRQGADVALLVRRLREAVDSDNLQCVGTSATLAGEGTFAEQQVEVSKLATTFFGANFHPENVIGETLTRTTDERSTASPEFIDELKARIERIDQDFPESYQEFIQEPLVSWVESTFGVTREEETGRLVRAVPASIIGKNGAAQRLSALTGASVEDCVRIINRCLLHGCRVIQPETQQPVFAFRLHQFISSGDTVYATLEKPQDRYLTVNYQKYKPGDRDKILLPVVFCRECGQEYYGVRVTENIEEQRREFTPRDFTDQLKNSDDQAAYIYISDENPWPESQDEIVERVPDDWREMHGDEQRVRRGRRKNLPEHIHIDTAGKESTDGQHAALIQAPFRFCLNCGVSYNFRIRSDYTKLTALSSGGRSTSTTILSLSTIRHLQAEGDLPEEARKLLSFTDNRQDAALQAGHFNDFVETSLIRAALYQAVLNAGESGLRHDELTQRVAETLNLDLRDYASDPDVRFIARQETEAALRDVLGYRLYRDLKDGWRVTAPNLEQCGLLKIKYLSLEDVCSAEDIWEGKHHVLVSSTPETREKVAQVLLDYIRRELAIQVNYLSRDYQERIKQRSNQRLKSPWGIDENENMLSAGTMFPRSRRKGDYGGNVFVSARGGFGLYLNHRGTFENYEQRLDLRERSQIILDLLEAMRVAGIVEIVAQPENDDDVPGYQLKAASIIWLTGDGTKGYHDRIRVPRLPQVGIRTNPFFVDFYKSSLNDLKYQRAREHTAQVSYDEREKREKLFREGALPILFCSPTMELGIDISLLNVVNMRNVPPTPANYAQRSGRAGRNGQPALVFTYCAKGSPHDQYFFKRKERMVSGAVSPPSIDLTNADLIRAHLHAVWLAETDTSLGTSLKDILDITGNPPSLDLIDQIKNMLEDLSVRNRARRKAERVIASLQPTLEQSDWFNEKWLMRVFEQIPSQFKDACNRWRDLYMAALKQRDLQNAIIGDASRPSADRERARKLRREAENQIELLLESRNVMQSDFYIYRYFASEGFLPGYNFPRLPLSAYIPARRVRTDEGEYLSRPRFLAISEFGPRSIVYHEGSRYVINRVIMSVTSEEDDSALATERVKLCPACGYLHHVREGDGLDLCERCDEPLSAQLSPLFRMQNVSTKRRDRISSDEEERLRFGYELRTAFRFHQENEHFHIQKAEVVAGDRLIARLTYGDNATIWRINLGWRRRANQNQYGFVLDIEQGYWQRNEAIEDDQDDPMGQRTQRVIPYVEDRKNSLLFEPVEQLSLHQMASLTAAFKKAIQINYELEDSELAAEALPAEDERRAILFYEAAEGGAGILRKLVQDPVAISEIAVTALEICHFDPESGVDHKRALLSNEDCEAACYDCLMSYYNQRDHRLLDRQLIRDLLMEYRDSRLKASPTAITRDEHYQRLRRLCQSDLEEKWLDYLQENGYRLPTKAQLLIEDCSTRPDFIYEDDFVVIYIDGYHHLDEERQKRDTAQQSCLEDMGYTVLRFGLFDDWPALIEDNQYLFGKAS